MPSYSVRPPSVRPSVTFVFCIETRRHIFKLFNRRVATPFWFFHTKRNGGKTAIFDQYLALGSMTGLRRVPSTILTVAQVYSAKCRLTCTAQTVTTKRHPSMNFVWRRFISRRVRRKE